MTTARRLGAPESQILAGSGLVIFVLWKLQHVDRIIAVPAWTLNVLVIAGWLWAYARSPQKPQPISPHSPSLSRFFAASSIRTPRGEHGGDSR